jgi:putative DNA primase/helicase
MFKNPPTHDKENATVKPKVVKSGQLVEELSVKLIDAALKYAQRGWPVLLLVPGKKTPLTENGFYDATVDEAQIRKWWTEHPDANVGIRVGAESNLLVIDVDNKGGKNGSAELEILKKQYGPLPVTRIVRTPTGGFHFYFTFPEWLKGKPLKKELAPGVDLKFNGYVVAPPSIIRDGSYEIVAEEEDID